MLDVVSWLLSTAGGPLLVFLIAQNHAARQRSHGRLELLGAVAIPFAANVLISASYRWLLEPAQTLLGNAVLSFEAGPILISPYEIATLLAVTAVIYTSLSPAHRRGTQLLSLPEAYAWPAIGAATAALALWTLAMQAAALPVAVALYPALIIFGLTWPQLRRAVDGDERPHVPPWWTIGLSALLLSNPLSTLFETIRWGGAPTPQFLLAMVFEVLLFATLAGLRNLARSPWAVFIATFASALAAGMLSQAAGLASGWPG